MQRSTERIMVSHAGVLPRPSEIAELFAPDANVATLGARRPAAVKHVVQRQIDAGIDVVNDGEYSKRGGYSGYVRDRFSGLGSAPQTDALPARVVRSETYVPQLACALI